MDRSISRALVLLILISPLAHAKVTLPPIFGDHMALQRGIDLPIWGNASPNEKVTIEFAGKTTTANADDNGNFTAKLPPAQLAEPSSMTIKIASSEPLVISDVLVGDVWICSGQSNMGFQLKSGNDAENEITNAHYPTIR